MPNITGNVNRTGGHRTAGPASGRVRHGARQVFIQRNPHKGHSPTQRLDMRTNTRIGTWNIRSLNATGAVQLLCDELESGHIEIMGLQEIRWHGAGEMVVGNRHLLWSGPPEGQPRQGGVGLILTRYAANALSSWHPVNDRILVARFRHRFGVLSVVVVYAPTNEASPTDKDEFYQTPESAMLLNKTTDLVICLGDFNAVTGFRCTTSSPVGPFWSGSPNDNSDRLVSFCKGAQLRIAGSWFRRKDIHRYTWFSNDGRTCKEIDHTS